MRQSGIIRTAAKFLLTRTIWRPGTVRRILRGPSKGLRYRLFSGYGSAPVFGGWEPEAQEIMLQHLKPGSVAYDLGANYGIHTILMARIVGPTGRVYAFEPMPRIMSHLRENVELNGFQNVTFVPIATSDSAGTAEFIAGLHEGAGHLAAVGPAGPERISVETIRLDDFVYARGNRPPNFIKMDIEGAEGRAFAGAERVLESARPVILVDLHSNEQDVAVGRILAKYSYVAHRTADGKQVTDFSKGRPDPDGLWDQILCVPADGT